MKKQDILSDLDFDSEEYFREVFKEIESNLVDLSVIKEDAPEMLTWVRENTPICVTQWNARLKQSPKDILGLYQKIHEEGSPYGQITEKDWNERVGVLADFYADLIQQHKGLGFSTWDKFRGYLWAVISNALKNRYIDIVIEPYWKTIEKEDGQKEVYEENTRDPIAAKDQMTQDLLEQIHKRTGRENLSDLWKRITELFDMGLSQTEMKQKLSDEGYKISQPTISRIISDLKKLDLV